MLTRLVDIFHFLILFRDLFVCVCLYIATIDCVNERVFEWLCV